MSASERPDDETNTGAPQPQPGDWWIWSAVFAVVLVMLCFALMNFNKPRQLAPVSAALTSGPTAKPIPADANSRMGTRVWNPINLPHDSKATFTTTFRNPGIVDYQFFLTGEPDTIRRLFDSQPKITLSLLDVHNKPIEQHTIDPQKLNLNGDGFILHEASFAMPLEQYNSIADWNVEVRFDRYALQPPSPPAPTAYVNFTPPPPPPSPPSRPAPPLAPAFAPPQNFAPPQQAPPRPAPQAVPPLPTIDAALEQRLATLERLCFGSPASNLPLNDRLDRLETQVFQQTSSNLYPDQRVHNLEASIYSSGQGQK